MKLLKFTNKKWADLFVKGDIFANSIYNFRNIKDDIGRGDIFEGCYETVNKDDLDDNFFTSGFSDDLKENIIGNVVFIDEGFKFIKVFSLYNLENNIIDERILEFGDTCVLIKDNKEFFDRISLSLENLNINIDAFFAHDVRYYAHDDITQFLDPFSKLKNFEWQREFRVIFVPNDNISVFDTLPLKINIGDISDITEVYNAKKFVENNNNSF